MMNGKKTTEDINVMMKTLVLLVVLTICIPSVSFAGEKDEDFLGRALDGDVKDIFVGAQGLREGTHFFTIVRKIIPKVHELPEKGIAYRVYSCFVLRKGNTECWHRKKRMYE